jgi:hypothetical protein
MSPQGRPKGEVLSAQREGLLASAGMHAPLAFLHAWSAFARQALHAAVLTHRGNRRHGGCRGRLCCAGIQRSFGSMAPAIRPIPLGNVYG